MGKSWITRNLPGLALTVGGGVLSATGVGAPIGAPMAAAGLGMLGSDAANEANKKEQERAFGRSQDSAREQMRFQEYMSNTAQTRARMDAEKAGYNPMLPAINGNSASSPSGSQAKAEAATMENTLGKGLANAVELKRLMQDLKGADSQIMLNEAMAKKAASEGILNAASARAATANARASEAQYNAIVKEAKARGNKADWDAELSTYDAIMNRAARESGTVGTAADVFRYFKTLPGGTKLFKNKKGQVRIGKDEMVVNKNTGEIIHE